MEGRLRGGDILQRSFGPFFIAVRCAGRAEEHNDAHKQDGGDERY
jgi:hypothetical protein